MSWRETTRMTERKEFVALAQVPGAKRRDLCRRFGISAQTGYKWLARARAGGADWAQDRSRRPHCSPGRLEGAAEAAILAVRDAHPAWGARKIAACLGREGLAVPAASTVHAVLVRHGRIVADPQASGGAPGRFEHAAPNLMWQMDFKGWVVLGDGQRCHPLTAVDDHSRYLLCLSACADQRRESVQPRLEAMFRRYGLPGALLVDNGTPWGDGPNRAWTRLGVWLLKLDVELVHSRPYHPQTRGKNERLHRTLNAELLARVRLRDLADAQRHFDRWRPVYNTIRPHEALGQQVPASRYVPSPRAMPDRLPQIEYPPGEVLRTVGTTKAYVSYRGRLWNVPGAFAGERVAIRPIERDGRFGVFFGARKIADIDLNEHSANG